MALDALMDNVSPRRLETACFCTLPRALRSPPTPHAVYGFKSSMRFNNKLETSDSISLVFAVLSLSERWNFNIPLYKADALENAT